MSLKENVDYIKDELTSQEQFLSGFVKAERFLKKHKLKLIAILGVIFIGAIGLGVKTFLDNKNKAEANIAFTKFLENPKDTNALDSLKNTNNELYQIAQYMVAKKENKQTTIEVKYLKEINEFDAAIKANDIKKLEQLSMNENFLLKEYAIFYRALLLAQQNKIAEANTILKSIPQESNLKELVNLLKHYLITKG